MLTFLGAKQGFCDGVNRRNFLKIGAFGAGLTLADMLRLQAQASNAPNQAAAPSRPKSAIPSFVSLRGMSRGTEPGFLGISHRPFSPNGPGVDNLRPLQTVNQERMADRRAMLESFDGLRREVDSSAAGLDTFTARAFDMVSSGGVRNALDLSREPSTSRGRYQGVEPFLTARRLVESGVGCVTMAYGGWDTHGQNFQNLRRQLPPLDKGLSLLVGDLSERGLLNDVVIVMWGEFGRTPRINQGAGRDHWSPVMSALVAGGGMRMGQAIGSSTARGERPQERRVSAPQVLATLYRAIGIDPAITFPNGAGRPVHIVEDRAPITELLG